MKIMKININKILLLTIFLLSIPTLGFGENNCGRYYNEPCYKDRFQYFNNESNDNKSTNTEKVNNEVNGLTGEPIESRVKSNINFVQKGKLPFESDFGSVQLDNFVIPFPEYNHNLKNDGSDFWPEDELKNECSDLGFSDGAEIIYQPVKTGLDFKFISRTIFEEKFELDVKKDEFYKDQVLYVDIHQENQHQIRKAEIIANYRIQKYKSTIPLLGITTDECSEVYFQDFSIKPSHSSMVSTIWLPFSSKKKIVVEGLNPTQHREEGRVDLREYLGSANKDGPTKITVTCPESSCGKNISQTLMLDLAEARKEYEVKAERERIEREKELERLRKQAEVEAERLRIEHEKMDAAAKEEARRIEIQREERYRTYQEKEKERIKREIMETPVNKLNEAEKKIKIDEAKKQCIDIGFKPDTKKFRECILELM